VRVLSDKQTILNTEAIAIDQDPLGIAGDIRLNQTDGGQIWSRQLSNNAWAAILYNQNILWGDTDLTLPFTPDFLLGWPSKITTANVRDIWQKVNYVGISNYTVQGLTPHSSIMLRITPGST